MEEFGEEMEWREGGAATGGFRRDRKTVEDREGEMEEEDLGCRREIGNSLSHMRRHPVTTY